MRTRLPARARKDRRIAHRSSPATGGGGAIWVLAYKEAELVRRGPAHVQEERRVLERELPAPASPPPRRRRGLRDAGGASTGGGRGAQPGRGASRAAREVSLQGCCCSPGPHPRAAPLSLLGHEDTATDAAAWATSGRPPSVHTPPCLTHGPGPAARALQGRRAPRPAPVRSIMRPESSPEIHRRCIGYASEIHRRNTGGTPEIHWKYTGDTPEIPLK